MRTALVIARLLFSIVPGSVLAAAPPTAAEQSLELIRNWVSGQYDNSLQAERDLANQSIPDELKHRLMHQLFVPVPVAVPALPGYLVYQQSSVDGSEDPESITRAGLLQFFIDDTGRLRQRELNFKDLGAFRNAHQNPERFRSLTLDQFRFDPACDFFLSMTRPGREVSGPMQAGACRFFSQGLQKTLTADDAVTIRAGEYWFLGRFRDDAGAIMWGNASDEPVKLRRRPTTD